MKRCLPHTILQATVIKSTGVVRAIGPALRMHIEKSSCCISSRGRGLHHSPTQCGLTSCSIAADVLLYMIQVFYDDVESRLPCEILLQHRSYHTSQNMVVRTGPKPVQTGQNQSRTGSSPGPVQTSPGTTKDHGPNRTAVQSWSYQSAYGPRLVLVPVLPKFGKRPDRTGPQDTT